MPKKQRLSLNDLERETKKFGAPSTDKERDILAAAADLLGERGIEGATTAEIARRAGVTERTLFRYFPTKRDLVRRVLYPMLHRGGLAREWQTFEALLASDAADLKSWYVAFTTQRFGAISRNPALVRTLLVEMAQNKDLRDAVAALWHPHVRKPLMEGLGSLQTRGEIRADVDLTMLLRAIHCLNVGYFFVRYVFAPDADWNDTEEIEKTAELLVRGCADASRPSTAKT